MKRCPVCNKEFQDRGFGGHMWGVHGIKIGPKATLLDLQRRVEDIENRLAPIDEKIKDLPDLKGCSWIKIGGLLGDEKHCYLGRDIKPGEK